MNLFKKIDNVVWGESNDVWNDTFSFLLRYEPSSNVLNEIVVKCISTRHDEFKVKYYKVLRIMDESNESEGLLKLSLHYQRIMFRYRLAHECCRTLEYVVV
jgi:hypothetical protein